MVSSAGWRGASYNIAACADLAADVRLSKRLSASPLSALNGFWVSQNGGLTPFAFYNPFDVASGQQIGNNYDPTGNETQGRVTVAFRGNWAQATDIGRSNVQGLEWDARPHISSPKDNVFVYRPDRPLK